MRFRAMLIAGALLGSAAQPAHSAGEENLQPGEWVEVPAGKPSFRSWRLPVSEGDYVRGRIEGDGVRLELVGNGDGAARVLADTDRNIRDFQFVAERSGKLELRARRTSGSGLRLTVSEIVPFAAQTPPVPAIESARLRELAADLARDGSTDAFWARIARTGAPLVETVDADSALVTFLWRGAKQNVRLFGAPSGDHDPLARLGASDVWYRSYRLPRTTRMSYQFAPDVPELDRPAKERRLAIRSVTQADPFNPRRYPEGEADRFAADSVLELDRAPPQPWIGRRPDVPRGTLERRALTSARLGNVRDIHFYRSAGYRAGQQDNILLVLFDAEDYLTKIPTPDILDNMVADGRLPPLAAILVGNPSRVARSAELPCNPAFSDFLAEELLPFAARNGLSAPAPRTVVGGSSYGGLAAACAALRRPDSFGNVLSLSGSYWWAPQVAAGRAEEAAWVPRRYAQEPLLPVRFYLDAGLFETGSQQQGILETNRHLRDVLRAKGYRVTYAEHFGGHDYLVWRGSLSDGLLALFGGQE